MKAPAKVVIVTLLLGILGFLTEPNGPLGSFWAPAPTVPQAIGAQVPLFMILPTAPHPCASAPIAGSLGAIR